MKAISKILPALVLLISLLSFVSCSNDTETTVNPPINQGSWKVSHYWDNVDETSNFSNYTFKFNDGGQVTATIGTNVKTGTWTETATRFNIDFGIDPVLGDLNNDWVKEERTATSIKLKEDNPAQDDKLQFIKL